MGTSIFGIGVSALNAAQVGLATTAHNIANVSTPGFSRQEAVVTTRPAQFSGSGYLGQGVDVGTVRRVYSDYLTTQTWHAQAGASQLDRYNTQTAQLANLFGDATSGLAPSLSDFFSSVNAVAANPADAPSRQSLLSSAQGLVSRFHDLSDQLTESRDGINTQVRSIAGSVTTLAQGIAQLNTQIAKASAGSSEQLPNDMLDQRDDLLTQLNQQVGVNAVAQSDGSINVFLANGQALVVGQQATQLVAVPDPADARNLTIGLKTGSSTLVFRSSDVSGGALAGLLTYRKDVLDPSENALGRIAIVTADAFNAQHHLGIDLTGALGGDFFQVPAPHVLGPATNASVVTATLSDSSQLTTSDYSLRYDGSNYTLTRLSDNQAQVFATLPRTVDGIQLALGSGTPTAGDAFSIQPTRGAASAVQVAITSTSAIAAGSPIRTSSSPTNLGHGLISAGSVDAAYLASPLASPLALAYNTAGMLTGFPAGAAVTVTANGTSTTYPPATPVPYTSGAALSFGGMSFTVTGTLSAGDTFTVAPNPNGIGDNRNALLLASLQSRNVVGGSGTLAGAYGQLVGAVGDSAHQAQLSSDAQAELLSQSQQAQQSVSGVNLDEEAANLQRYQQAYQAAGKVIATAQSMFQTILDIMNR